MDRNFALARWCGLAGLAGIAVGVAGGIYGQLNSASVYASMPDVFQFATPEGKTALLLVGLAVLGFTAAYLGFNLVGAAGYGVLGKTAAALTLIGSLGTVLGFWHGAAIGSPSPLIYLGFLIVPGWILLAVAAVLIKRVPMWQALVPVASMIVVFGVELMTDSIPLDYRGIADIVHQTAWGAIAFVVLMQARSTQSAQASPRAA